MLRISLVALAIGAGCASAQTPVVTPSTAARPSPAADVPLPPKRDMPRGGMGGNAESGTGDGAGGVASSANPPRTPGPSGSPSDGTPGSPEAPRPTPRGDAR